MNHIFYAIRDNLLRSYIYYIPDSLFENINKTAYKNLIKKTDLNKVSYFDEDRIGSTNLSNINTIDFVTKSKYLQENILQLFKAKETINAIEFQFVLDAYKEHLGIHTFLTEQMAKHLKTYIKNVTPTIENLFQKQAQDFAKHFQQMTVHFGAIEKPQFSDKNIVERFKEKFSQPLAEKLEFPKINTVDTPIIKKEKKPRKKQPIITNEEADNFLLETVFNVDFSKVK
ncbi:hypothetical protein [Pontimicrobium sp. IMCC45349]|uniref:hypothetical protein n=1 Tax=Pontimicrobium sp. IMCC45349 TaxID=3391574 RepID=UPI0039A1A1FD